jgi:phosphoglycerate dehydrogenase-like enzyme
MKVVIHFRFGEELVALIRAAAPGAEVVVAETEEEAIREIEDAEVLLGLFPRAVFLRGKRLKWVQSYSAGMDKLLFPEVVDSDVILTNSARIYATHAAEHAFALLLALSRGLHHAIRCQEKRQWRGGPVYELNGGTLGIIGMGGFGEEMAKRGKGFNLRVLAVDPVRTGRPEGVDELWKMDRLDDLLTQSDVVMITAPRTPETIGMIGREQLARMKPTAYLINVSRGGIIDEAALAEALNEGRLAGAGLDVCDVEPLTPESPLWDCENLILTPHAAGGSQHRPRRTVELFAENLRRYVAGEPLLNVVDKQRGF